MKDLTVILPAYNEESTIGQVIDEVRLWANCEVVVVDNASTDGTYSVALDREVKVVIQSARGKANAMKMGFSLVRTPYVVMLDSDYTYPAIYIPEIHRLLRMGADVVMGYRKWRSPGSMAFTNLMGNKALSLLASMLYRGVKDVCTGLWGFRKESLDKFSLSSNGFTLEADLFVNLVKQDCHLVQIPISYRARLNGSQTKLKVSDGIKIGKHLISAKWKR